MVVLGPRRVDPLSRRRGGDRCSPGRSIPSPRRRQVG